MIKTNNLSIILYSRLTQIFKKTYIYTNILIISVTYIEIRATYCR